MSLAILPLSNQTSQILIGISVCIVIIALAFAIIIIFRQDKSANLAGKINYDLNSTKVPVFNQEKIHYGEQELLDEIWSDEKIDLDRDLSAKAPIVPLTEPLQTFMCSELQINPSVAKREQQIEISCKVSNHGTIADNYHASLRINGQAVSNQMVNLSPGATKKVIFVGTEKVPGIYLVEVNGLRGRFSVSE